MAFAPSSTGHSVQDQVVRMIVATLAGRLQAARVEKALRKPPASLAAYDCVLRADALHATKDTTLVSLSTEMGRRSGANHANGRGIALVAAVDYFITETYHLVHFVP
jgi:hypothetical protein